MEMKVGDWVRTALGREGEVVLLSRLAAFIDFDHNGVIGPFSYLLSELTKIDSPIFENDFDPRIVMSNEALPQPLGHSSTT